MYDELELDLIGDRKTVLFFIISDTDATFNLQVYAGKDNLCVDDVCRKIAAMNI